MLESSYVEIIVQRIKEIREELDYQDEVIRDDIFKLLRKNGKIVFFPLEEEPDLDGFHVVKILNGEPTAFVYINTAKNFEKCIFCGAHELGHIYEIEKTIQKAYPDTVFTNEQADDIMNRFAAELLMPRKIFVRKFKELLLTDHKELKYITYGDLLKAVTALMDYFYVPYKAVIWRLQEIGFLTESGKQEFEDIEKEDKEIINTYIYEGKYTRLRHPTYIRSFENLPEYLIRAEEEELLSKRKIQSTREEFKIGTVASSEKIGKTEESTLEEAAISKEFLDDRGECGSN